MNSSALTGDSLEEAVRLLDRLELGGGIRELVALSIRLDSWVDFTQDIVLPDGSRWPERGYRLPQEASDDGVGNLWLLSGGRLLQSDEGAGGSDVNEVELAELSDDMLAEFAGRLRRALVGRRIDEARLDEVEGQLLQRTVAELLMLARELEAKALAQVLAALRQAMVRGGQGWTPVAVHLRAGYERALGSRHEDVLSETANALVALATVGPFPPPEAGDPQRIFDVLFRVPRPAVHAAALRAIKTLRSDQLEPLAERIGPMVRQALTSPDATVRRLAGDVELLLASAASVASDQDAIVEDSADLAAILRDLDESVAFRRVAALRRVGDRASRWPALLPRLLEALEDEDAEVRASAVDAAEPLLAVESTAVRTRVVTALMRSPDADAVEAGLRALGRPPFTLDRALAVGLLRAALDGPESSREAVALVLAADSADQAPAEAAEGYGRLLRHADPNVRRATLRAVARDAKDRVHVREALTHDLMARLDDPLPELGIEAGRTLLALGHPGGPEIVSRLAADPRPAIRQGAVELLRAAGERTALATAEILERDVGILFDLAKARDGDARMRWSKALSDLLERRLPQGPDVLVALLKAIPPDASEPFTQFALRELDKGLEDAASLAPGGLAGVCHRLMELPHPRPEHAARVAAMGAMDQPQLFDFLWTMVTAGQGTAAEAARRALGSLAGKPPSDAVRAVAARAWQTADSAQRDALRHLLGGPP